MSRHPTGGSETTASIARAIHALPGSPHEEEKHADASSFPECTSSRLDRRGHDVDNKIPITDLAPLNKWVSRSITDQRVVAQLSSLFGLLAIFLSAIGIYGLMSYVVSRRTNEIGIRMALGAERMHVRWLVMREVLLLVVIGIAIGASAAFSLVCQQIGGKSALWA